ncbi:MAG: hypothetical protein EPO21_14265 [Chloroflexota bacterium]|nr:MAG: hypothetical protein EPO21_14265 [Chloroflexota bacterium]
MAVYDGARIANDGLLEVARLCAMAALKSPQMTQKTNITIQVLTDEDVLPIIEVTEALGQLEKGLYYGEAITLRPEYERGTPPVILLIGSNNITSSELNWNCGACGWPTCAELNRYSAQIRKDLNGASQAGPSCIWKELDFGAACSWACAAASHYNVENRITGSIGDAAKRIGYLEDCNSPVGLIVGPCRDQIYFSRAASRGRYTEQDYREYAMRALPQLWTTSPWAENAPFKYGENWEQKKKILKLVDEEIAPEVEAIQQQVTERIEEIKSRVQAKRRTLCVEQVAVAKGERSE